MNVERDVFFSLWLLFGMCNCAMCVSSYTSNIITILTTVLSCHLWHHSQCRTVHTTHTYYSQADCVLDIASAREGCREREREKGGKCAWIKTRNSICIFLSQSEIMGAYNFVIAIRITFRMHFCRLAEQNIPYYGYTQSENIINMLIAHWLRPYQFRAHNAQRMCFEHSHHMNSRILVSHSIKHIYFFFIWKKKKKLKFTV